MPENFADLLAHPEAHRFPCDWPEPITIDRRLPLDRTFTWEEYTFRLAPMSGHTRFSAAICFEADGKRFVHTGDQHFFDRPKFAPDTGSWQGGAAQPERGLPERRLHPQLSRQRGAPRAVAAGHHHLRPPARDVHRRRFLPPAHLVGRGVRRRSTATAMVLGDDEAHFDVDGWGGWIWPYRVHVNEGETARVTVTVRNPLPDPARAHRAARRTRRMGGERHRPRRRPAGRGLGRVDDPPRGPLPAAADRGGASRRRPELRPGGGSAGDGRRRGVLIRPVNGLRPRAPAGRRGRS